MFFSRVNFPLRRLAAISSLVVVDQALLSTAGFVSTLLLARWLSPAVFGVFSTLQSLSQIITGSAYSSLLLEPMSVLGPSVFASSPKAYEHFLTIAHVCLTLGLALLVVPILWAVLGSTETDLPAVALVFVLFLPLSLAPRIVQRYCYNKHRISRAAVVSGVYFVTSLSALACIKQLGYLSSITAWVASAACGALASSTILVFSRQKVRPHETLLAAKYVIREHWAFGRWALIGSAIFLISQQLPIMAMTRWFGPSSAGALRALVVLIVPVALLSAPASSAVLPLIATAEARGNGRHATWLSFMVSAGLTSLAVVYLLAAYLFAAPVVRLLYGQKYDEISWLVPLLAFQSVAYTATIGCDLHMRAARWPKFLAIFAVVTLIASATNTLVLVRNMGLVGTVYTIVITNIAASISRLVVYVWWRHDRKKGASSAGAMSANPVPLHSDDSSAGRSTRHTH